MATAAASKNTSSLAAQRAEVSKMTMYDWVALDKRGKRMKGEMSSKNAVRFVMSRNVPVVAAKNFSA